MSNGVFNFNFLVALTFRDIGGPKFTLGGPTFPGRPQRIIFFYPKRVLHVVLLRFKFQHYSCSSFRDFILQANTLGALCPSVRPRTEKFLYRRRVLYYVKWRFQFQLSSSCIFRDIRESQIYIMGPYAPFTPPSGEFFLTVSEYFTMSNCVLNFNIIALLASKILGGPKFILRLPVPFCTPPRGKIFVPQASPLLCQMPFSI